MSTQKREYAMLIRGAGLAGIAKSLGNAQWKRTLALDGFVVWGERESFLDRSRQIEETLPFSRKSVSAQKRECGSESA